MLALALADVLLTLVCQLQQQLAAALHGLAVAWCIRVGAGSHIAAQLAEAAGHLPLGLQQQALSIAGEFAGCQ